MSKIRIFSKKAFAIGPGLIKDTDKIESFVTTPGSFQDMPAEYVNDPTYLLAVRAGEITVINNRLDATAAEQGFTAKAKENKPMSEEQEFFHKIKAMNKEEVYKTISDLNLDVVSTGDEPLKVLKKKAFEAYKIARADAGLDEDEDEDGTDED